MQRDHGVGARHYFGLIVLLLMGACLRLWGINWGLQNANASRRPHPDEWALYWLFQWFGKNHNLNPCPGRNQCFFDWGTLYPYLAFGMRTLTSPLFSLLPSGTFGAAADQDFVQSALAGRIVSVITSVLAIYVAYRLAREAYGPLAGLVAGCMISLSGLLVQLAHFGTPDSTTVLVVCCALYAMMLHLRTPSGMRLAIAGVAVGLAMASEYHMGLLLIPLITCWALSLKRRVSWLILSCAIALLVCTVINTYALIDFSSFVAATEHTLSIRTVDSSAQYGDRWSRYGSEWLYVLRYALGYGVGFVLTAWMVAGVVWGLLRRGRTEALLFSWLAPYFILVSLSPAKFMRYSAPLLPVLAVLAGGLTCALLTRNSRSVRYAAFAAAAAALLYTGVYDAAYTGMFASADPRSVAAAWLSTHGTWSATVSFEELPNGLLNMPYFVHNGSTPQCYAGFKPARLHGPQDFLLLDDYALEEHPRVSNAAVALFLQSLNRNHRYQLVRTVRDVPTFLGMQFPIDGSPHDWRYPAHVIRIYRHTVHDGAASRCYPNLSAALSALYVPGYGT